MYHLNPHDYGQGYFVLATSKEEALEFILNSNEYGVDEIKRAVMDNKKFPYKFTMDEHSIGQVVRHEIA